MTAIFAQRQQPLPEKVTFDSLFREHAAVKGQPPAGNVPIPDWQRGGTAPAKAAGGQAGSKAAAAAPASRQTQVGNLREPLEIISDWTEADRKAGTITFGGKVIAKQRDMVLYADRLTNYFDLDTQTLIRAVATGNVKMSQADKFVTCEQAILEQDKRLITLRGNVVMWQADNRVTGEKIVIHLDSKQAEVFGGQKGKAKVRITPKQR
jgi:lipopolysaccharide export system protein LptA